MIEAFKLHGKIILDGAKEAKKRLEELQKKADETGQKFKDFGDKIKGAGEKMATGLSAPLAAFGTAAAVSAAQVNDSAAEIQQELGLTAEEASKLQGVAQDLWAQGFGENLATVSTKVAEVKKSLGDLNEEDLGTVTKGLELFERRGWGDTKESLKAVRILMNDFGMTAEEATDSLTAGFQQNLNYSDEFLDVVSEYGTYFNEMGFAGKEMFDFLASGAEGGAFQLDKVGVAMQEFTFSVKSGDKAVVEAFEAMNLNAAEMTDAFNKGGDEGKAAFEKTIKALQGVEDETLRNQIATDLFKTGYEDLGEKAFDALLEASESLENVEGATDRANDAFEETFSTRLASTIREIQLGLAPLGGVILDIAERHLPPLLEKVGQVVTWFQNLSSRTQDLIVYLGLFLIALGPILVILGTLIGALGNIIPVVVKIWGWFSKLRLLFMVFSGPIGWVILAVMALVAAGIWLYQNWEMVSAWLSETFTWLWNKAVEIFGNIKQAIVDEAIKTKDAAVNKFNEIKDGIVNAVTNAKNKVVEKFNEIKNNISEKINDIKNNATEKFNAIKDAIWKPIEEAKNKVDEFIGNILGFLDFDWEIPKPKVPKISLKWAEKSFLGANIKYPTGFNVEWAARGGILDGASLVGAGEAGKELLMPLEGEHFKPVAKMIADNINMLGGSRGGTIEIPIVVNGRELARAIVNDLDKEIERNRTIRKRGL